MTRYVGQTANTTEAAILNSHVKVIDMVAAILNTHVNLKVINIDTALAMLNFSCRGH